MSVTLVAKRGKMGDNTFYCTTMKANTLINEVGYASELDNWDDMTVDEKMQREIKGERVLGEMVPYVTNDQDWFFGALIVDVYKGGDKVKFQTFDEMKEVLDINLPAYEETLTDTGFLTLPDSKRLIALDGQHRLAALSTAIRGKNGIPGSVLLSKKMPENLLKNLEPHPEIGESDICVMFIIHENDRKIRKIFNKVNRYAKQTSRSDNIITSEDDVIAIVARRMFSAKNAPLGPINGSEIVNWKSNTVPARGRYLTTLSAIYTVCETILAYYDITSKTPVEDEVVDRATEIMNEFWTISMNELDIFKEYVEYIRNDKPLEKLRSSNLMLKPVTHTALGQAVYIAMTHGYTYRDIVGKINQIDWSFNNPVWVNILVTSSTNKRMITGAQALRNAGEVIAYMVIGDDFKKQEKEQLLQKLRDAADDQTVQLPEIIK